MFERYQEERSLLWIFFYYIHYIISIKLFSLILKWPFELSLLMNPYLLFINSKMNYMFLIYNSAIFNGECACNQRYMQ